MRVHNALRLAESPLVLFVKAALLFGRCIVSSPSWNGIRCAPRQPTIGDVTESERHLIDVTEISGGTETVAAASTSEAIADNRRAVVRLPPPAAPKSTKRARYGSRPLGLQRPRGGAGRPFLPVRSTQALHSEGAASGPRSHAASGCGRAPGAARPVAVQQPRHVEAKKPPRHDVVSAPSSKQTDDDILSMFNASPPPPSGQGNPQASDARLRRSNALSAASCVSRQEGDWAGDPRFSRHLANPNPANLTTRCVAASAQSFRMELHLKKTCQTIPFVLTMWPSLTPLRQARQERRRNPRQASMPTR